MITITLERNGFHYTQTIDRGANGRVKLPITRNRAIEITEENPKGRFSGSGGFDTRQQQSWTWQVKVKPEEAEAVV